MRALLLLAAMLLALPAYAETNRTITVSGEAKLVAVPDMASLTVGAVGQGKDPISAMNETSAIVSRVIDRLAESGVEAKDIQTSSLRLDRQTRWDNRDNKEIFIGYSARNSVTVRVRDLSKLSAVLAAVLGDGANSLSNLTWGLQDPKQFEDEARRQAVQDAMAKAALYAEAAGVELGSVLSMRDTASPANPPSLYRGVIVEEAAAASDVPIAAGEVDTRAVVTMVFVIE